MKLVIISTWPLEDFRTIMMIEEGRGEQEGMGGEESVKGPLLLRMDAIIRAVNPILFLGARFWFFFWTAAVKFFELKYMVH